MSAAPSTSAESGASSLQRTGLSITVGDTKSIVLALQALQSKIRSLEQDRDFHQDQYESALQAHERYKIEMERQMEQERAAHRKREADLLELLRKAREERGQLEDALKGNKEDLGGFRKELEQMIAAEKEMANQREHKLQVEVARLQTDIKEEQTHRAALKVAVDKLKEEKETALATNERLRIAMDDLLTRYEELQQTQRPPPPSSASPRRGSNFAGKYDGARRVMSSSATRTERGTNGSLRPTKCVANVPPRDRQKQLGRVAQRVPRHTYEDPTCNSMLRDVRVLPDEAPPCAYPSVNSSLQQQDAEDVVRPRRMAVSARPRNSVSRSDVSPARRVRSVSAPPQQKLRSLSRGARGASPARKIRCSIALAPSTLSTRAIDEVERQIQQELEGLQQRYEDTMRQGSEEDLPRKVLNAALTRISGLINQKNEQLTLLKEARKELKAATSSMMEHRSEHHGDPHQEDFPSSVSVVDRQTRRAMLVNELRSLLAEAVGS